MNQPKVRRAILSVSDKTGLVDLGSSLHKRGVTLISTGGTAKTLAAADVPVVPIREITGNEKDAYFSGRMKTISFRFESSLLFDRTSSEHTRQAEELGISPIDLVVCNLYPFEETVAKGDVSIAEAVESIDIGGPCMIRAAAKNHQSVAVLCDPAQYAALLTELDDNDGSTSERFRQTCALKAFALTAGYDAAIAGFFGRLK